MQQFARDMDMDGRVHTVTFGVNTQMSEVKHALQESIQTGHWLVLHNAHLAETWPNDLLDLIKVNPLHMIILRNIILKVQNTVSFVT